jgi:hypothetical protein
LGIGGVVEWWSGGVVEWWSGGKIPGGNIFFFGVLGYNKIK